MHIPLKHSTPVVKEVSGRKLARRLARISAAQRALLAYELENGSALLHRLTRKQACAVARASVGYVATLSRASAAERERVRHGWLPLTTLHNRPTRTTLHNRPSDADLDRVIAHLGLDRIMSALDRATAPTA